MGLFKRGKNEPEFTTIGPIEPGNKAEVGEVSPKKPEAEDQEPSKNEDLAVAKGTGAEVGVRKEQAASQEVQAKIITAAKRWLKSYLVKSHIESLGEEGEEFKGERKAAEEETEATIPEILELAKQLELPRPKDEPMYLRNSLERQQNQRIGQLTECFKAAELNEHEIIVLEKALKEYVLGLQENEWKKGSPGVF